MATPTPSPRSEIDALLALVQKSALAAVAEYEQSGAGTIPTLNSADKHPLDDVAGSVALKRAIQDLEGACERLCTTLAAPSHTLLNVSRTRAFIIFKYLIHDNLEGHVFLRSSCS